MSPRSLRLTTRPWAQPSSLAGLFVAVALLSFVTATHAQSRPLREAGDVLLRALTVTPAQYAPPWLVRLCDFIASPRSTQARGEESAVALAAPAPTRPRERHVDRRDPYRGGVAPAATPLVAVTVQTETGATATPVARAPSATQPSLDPDDPYAAAPSMDARLTVSSVEADNPYF